MPPIPAMAPSRADVERAKEILRQANEAEQEDTGSATFKLLRGRLRHRGVDYQHGKNDTIKTDLDLEAIAGTNKCRLIAGTPKKGDEGDRPSGAGPVDAKEGRPDNQKAKQPGDEGRPGPDGDNDSLDSMTVDQLRHFANEEAIDLSGARTKAEIIAAIRTAQGEE